MKLVIAIAARQDVQEAVSWYDERSDLAGDSFLADLNVTFANIFQSPSRWRPLRPGDSRRVIHLSDFPFTVIYKTTQKQIKILIVRHDARREGFGLERD